ncbi:mechanosensitive ion channel family protein [Pseudogemmatithrix spongiicola]|uniref:Mechanosensitive ion channel family protein n=1 Tax=Pseudogemmatithrix spongiicola TaxID=3062599 RepID=A0AA49K2B7_9BACT|nr:mechanosensitive ion channel family protein [Gemmatimonadaceae bacterium 'strain 138']WKW16204.1 mechanosensitive ion channel family protein [Gemmatimonadaceae bacterium 'strain 318']
MHAIRTALLLLFTPLALAAQLLGRPAAPAVAPDTELVAQVVVDSASPRAAVARFLDLAHRADFAAAGRLLDLPPGIDTSRADELARRLVAVLDSRLWLDLEKVSPVAEGEREDGLPSDRELLGSIKLSDGREVAIRLARSGRGDERGWRFSQATVNEIDQIYADLPDHWIREHIPVRMLNPGPFDILYWQWIALLVLLPASALIGWALQGPTRRALRKLSAKTDTEFDDKLIAAAKGPLTLLWGVAASRVLLRWIALAAPAQAFIVELQAAIATVAVFWVILRAIGVLQETIPISEWGARHPALRSLIPLGARIARLIVFVIAVLTVVAQFGYPVATILAGLGIGGIAVALGAQKSLEHFFGSVSIGVDQPFRVGDWVNVGGVEGEVEAIGLRSTRIRTLARTIISVPNGQLAESRTENFAPRDRFLLRAIIGVEYGTSAATMRLLRDEIEKCLRAHPKTWPDRVQVRFSEFASSSLNFEMFCWILADGIDEFREIREGLFLQIMEIVEGNGAAFAFPTQTVHVVKADTTAR